MLNKSSGKQVKLDGCCEKLRRFQSNSTRITKEAFNNRGQFLDVWQEEM